MRRQLGSTVLLAGALLACVTVPASATAISFSSSQTEVLAGAGVFQVGINNGGNIGGSNNTGWGRAVVCRRLQLPVDLHIAPGR
jgi:hypothetical protein